MKRALGIIVILIIAFLLVMVVANRKHDDGGETVLKNQFKADTYGGQNPAETLKLLVEALKDEDLELASKYFALNDDGSREEWLRLLEEVQERGGLADLINKLDQAQPYVKDISHKNDFKFFIADEKGGVETVINLEKNSFSGVWKIESL